MMNRYHTVSAKDKGYRGSVWPLLLIFLAVLWAPVARASGNVIEIGTDDVTIIQGKKWGAKVTLPAAPEGHRAVLTFQAWYQAPKFVGYYRHLKVEWDKTPMTEVLGRPATFRTVGGISLDSFTEVGLLVPATDDPDIMKDDPLYQSRYRPEQDDDLDLTIFRFVLFNVDFAGEHTVVFENLFSDADGKYHSTLMLRKIRIIFEPIP